MSNFKSLQIDPEIFRLYIPMYRKQCGVAVTLFHYSKRDGYLLFKLYCTNRNCENYHWKYLRIPPPLFFYLKQKKYVYTRIEDKKIINEVTNLLIVSPAFISTSILFVLCPRLCFLGVKKTLLYQRINECILLVNIIICLLEK